MHGAIEYLTGDTMRASDKVISRVVLAPLAPIALLLAGWWGSLPVFGDSAVVGVFALAGFVAGVVLDATVLRTKLDSLQSLGDRALLLVALFYSIGMYGLFMGLPVFHVAIGVFGGYVVARRAVIMNWSRERALRDGRRVAWAMTWVLAALCGATAWLALREPTIGQQVQGMLGLSAPVTRPMIYAITVVGGVGLLALQFAGARVAARLFAPHE